MIPFNQDLIMIENPSLFNDSNFNILLILFFLHRDGVKIVLFN